MADKLLNYSNNTMTNEWIEWTGENRIRTPSMFRGSSCSSFLNNNQHNYKFNPSSQSTITSINTNTITTANNNNMGLKQQPQHSHAQQNHTTTTTTTTGVMKSLLKPRGLYLIENEG